jgi:hypothetical protein
LVLVIELSHLDISINIKVINVSTRILIPPKPKSLRAFS